MARAAFRHLVLLVITLAAVSAWTAPVYGQSQAELRRENERLKTEAADLQRELAAAREEIARLQDELAQLRAGASGGETGQVAPAPLPEVKVTIDETIPNASPRALMNALTEDYRTAMAEHAFGDDDRSNERAMYIREVQRWTTRVNRQYRSQIEWRVRIIDAGVRSGRGLVVRMQAVDPVTDAELGDPFDAAISRSLASRLQKLERAGELEHGLVLKGVLVPRVYFNQSRLTEGVFNNPRFIGPFAEYAFTVQTKSLIPPKPEPSGGEDADGAESEDGATEEHPEPER
jgi:hypothetical protein